MKHLKQSIMRDETANQDIENTAENIKVQRRQYKLLNGKNYQM